MKKTLLIVLQFAIFLVIFAVGSFMSPFHLHWQLTNSTTPDLTVRTVRYFVPDGLILMLVFYLFLILMQLLTKRFLKAAPWTTLALLLAATCGYAMKLGFITHDLF
jgi:hypothetical protein